jgi:hypothetical protein
MAEVEAAAAAEGDEAEVEGAEDVVVDTEVEAVAAVEVVEEVNTEGTVVAVSNRGSDRLNQAVQGDEEEINSIRT